MKQLQLRINEKQVTLLVDEHEMLSTVIREKARLTGTKIGCEQGSCGACTVLVNGKPVLSCITPAVRCENTEVTTIEALSKNGELHKLQQKFVEKGALQCGFCTPGMVITALDLVGKNPAVSLEEIKTGLSGNLCRCTGYKKIIEAVAEYAKEMDGGESTAEPPIKNVQPDNLKSVGIPRPYIESEKKVKGAAEYADDIEIKNALHCKFLRSIFTLQVYLNRQLMDATNGNRGHNLLHMYCEFIERKSILHSSDTHRRCHARSK